MKIIIKKIIHVFVASVMLYGAEAATHLQGTITPIIIPEYSTLVVQANTNNEQGLNFSLQSNSQDPDLKICKMVDIQDSQEVISYIVL